MLIGKPEFKRTIKEMQVGEKAYTLPWALVFDLDKIPYLNLAVLVQKSSEDYFLMPIEKIGLKETDYNIYVDFNYNGEKYKWNLEDLDFEEFEEEGAILVKLSPEFVSYDPKTRFESFLKRRREIAIRNEEYELAAKIRDRLNGKRPSRKNLSDKLAKKVPFIEEKKK